MENETNNNISEVSSFSQLHKVTPFSKYLAMALFVSLPFIAFYIGIVFAPVQYVEVEKVVYRDQINKMTDVQNSKKEQDSINSSTLRKVEKIDSSGVPESAIYVGDDFVLNVYGSCNFEPFNRADIFTYRPILKSLISSESAIVESGTCWWGGAGSELYRVLTNNTVRIIGVEIYECGNVPSRECTGIGEPKVLYETDSTGVVTTKYDGPIFGQ